MEKMNKSCKVCGSELIKKNGYIQKSFCSWKCKNSYKPEGKRVEKTCEVCSTPFWVWLAASKIGGGRFCSQSCMGKWNIKGDRNPMYDSQRFGDKNPNWKGGITNWRKNIYNSKEYKDWSNSVREFWNYTCQICSQRGKGDIHANHIKTFRDYPELRFDLQNGIALCKKCHISLVNHRETEWESYFNLCWENKNYDRSNFAD